MYPSVRIKDKDVPISHSAQKVLIKARMSIHVLGARLNALPDIKSGKQGLNRVRAMDVRSVIFQGKERRRSPEVLRQDEERKGKEGKLHVHLRLSLRWNASRSRYQLAELHGDTLYVLHEGKSKEPSSGGMLCLYTVLCWIRVADSREEFTAVALVKYVGVPKIVGGSLDVVGNSSPR